MGVAAAEAVAAEAAVVEAAADSARLRWQLLPPRQPHGAARSYRPMLICCQKRVHGACRGLRERGPRVLRHNRLCSRRVARLVTAMTRTH